MEAIGQLAGGVAHDFNNILGAIMLQAEMAESYDNLPPDARDLLHDIVGSAKRGANLTRQLLAFSRRQVLQPRRLDLNDVVTNLAKMLQRILGEDVHLQLNLDLSPLITHADSGMLDQVLMNLAVNARDAMPGGGRLVVETAATVITKEAARAIPEAAPGRYVCLRVSDTGCGIPQEQMTHIFEPFFTTKEPGKGTGLGLATVFGIVKQHHGSILVSSEIGRGTTFEVFLPASDSTSDVLPKRTAKATPRGGTETILVVEDDLAVRELTRTALERHGYQVLEAGNGVEALRMWEQHKERVQLLLTDMVMPEGVSGCDLAAQLQMQSPDLKVIFSSGYSANLAGRELQLREGQNFLPKPSPLYQILEIVRRSLDS
jgi:CheY-like chemotaxis protein